MRRATILIICLLTVLIPIRARAGAFDLDSLKMRLSSEVRDPVEGIWQTGGEGGAIVAIEAVTGKPGQFSVIILDSPSLNARPGMTVGLLESTGKESTYQARFVKPSKLGNPLPKAKSRDFICKIESPGRMTFTAFSKNRKISLWRWLPYLFRATVSGSPNRPSSSDGAIKLFPDKAKGIGSLTI